MKRAMERVKKIARRPKMKIFKKRQSPKENSQPLDHLKDFLYLDFERVRSFVAQFYSGLPETRILSGKKSESIDASLGFEAIAKTNAKVLTEKNVSETQSLHLALYGIFEAEAEKQNFIRHQNLEGPLIKVRCQIRLVDYKEMSEKIDLFARIMPLINRLQSPESQYTKAQRKAVEQEEKQQSQQFEDMSSIVNMIFGAELYGIGYIDNSPKFKMKLQKDLLQFKSSGLLGSSEELLTEEWTVVGMVVQKQKKPDEPESTDPMAKGIQDMNVAFDDMKKQLQSGENTAEVIPIAIYRELKPSKKNKVKS